MRELAKFLHQRSGVLLKFANNLGILYWAGRGGAFSKVPYVTEAGAMRLIAHVRAYQGGLYQQGVQFHEEHDREAAWMREYDRKRRAAKRQQRALMGHMGAPTPTNGGNTPQLPLANPPAGTDDEAPEALAPAAECRPTSFEGNPGGVFLLDLLIRVNGGHSGG